MIEVRRYTSADLPALCEIWNSVVERGEAFPQEQPLTLEEAGEFFAAQSFTGAAVDLQSGEVVGLYILHPNNVGRCGHIANASYAVKEGRRGQHIGQALVEHCLRQCRAEGFGILQFNAVVSTNQPAQRLYKRLGFVPLGVIPHGFRAKDGSFCDIIPHYFDIDKLEG